MGDSRPAVSRRDGLADVTARIVAEVGLAGLSMRDVAAAAGVTTGSVTHHFPARRDLLVFTFQASLDKVRRRNEADLAASDDRLRTRLTIGLPLDEDRLVHWRLLCALVLGVGSDRELAELQRNAYSSYVDEIEACLHDEVTRGRVPADVDVPTEARRLMAVMDGVAIQTLFDESQWPPERQLQILDAQLQDLRSSDGELRSPQPP
ncbi:MAG: TetR/AcrR family transcriptional regulator [Actinomycetota bacterium]